jgi:hypothetical protein
VHYAASRTILGVYYEVILYKKNLHTITKTLTCHRSIYTVHLSTDSQFIPHRMQSAALNSKVHHIIVSDFTWEQMSTRLSIYEGVTPPASRLIVTEHQSS